MMNGLTVASALLLASGVLAQTPARLSVDFGRTLQPWDGFGINYVEVPQTRDYQRSPQEYGGLSALSGQKRQEVLELIFGSDGLQPGVAKLFLDVWHEPQPGRWDHETTTKWMRHFIREGLKLTRARGGDLALVTTLYGPPAWMTKQGFVRGRDLDPAKRGALAEYFIHWAKYLLEKEKFPLQYISLHNEGEDFSRWPVDGSGPGHPTHDYNLYWTPRQVVEFIKILRPALDAAGLQSIGIAPGEPTNWDRFLFWGYAPAIAEDPDAMRMMGLISSHGFTGGRDYWYGTHESRGIELLRLKRPELKAWTTSMTWGRMDVGFVDDLRGQVYDVKVNAAIPWAAIQTSNWVGGDPNPGTAIRVIEDCGCYQVMPGYWFYKQVSRAGQPGMAVASVSSSDSRLRMMAFASKGTRHADAFVVINRSWESIPARIEVRGAAARRFAAWRTNGIQTEKFKSLGELSVEDGAITYQAAPNSVTTFFAR